ncbi:two-component system VirA-like sensor kinase [Pararhizobium qamdonense]|uniref:two-component system VirA-like sensor kinase n=1 Tax=Pararhizobium qamdonense TaxID=3031126 RepID=UPI0023E1CB07|nr:two-component system VirA-like sensor kinase [Pararhizobium qamdonense]
MILVAGAFSFAVFAFGRVPSREIHEAILTSLRAVDVNHASLQRDVLQARAGLLRNFDPLVTPIRTLHATVSRLGMLFPESGVETPSALSDELSKLSSSIDRDEELVEEFKTKNALLQNSLSIANQMLSKLHGAAAPEMRSIDTPNDLGNLMMRFALQPALPLAEDIRAQLDGMLKSDHGLMPDVRAYVVHAKMILNTLPAVDRIIYEIQASQTSEDARRLQVVYLDAYGEQSVRSSWSRALLGSIAILLCVYVASLIYRLRQQTLKLTQQLDVESLIADIQRRFTEGRDKTNAALTDSLAMLAQFFDASRHAFAILDSDNGATEATFGQSSHSSFEALCDMMRKKILLVRQGALAPWKPFYYENLQQKDLDHFPEGSLSAGSVVSAEIGGNSVALLFLEHSEIRKKPTHDEVRLLGQAIVALATCLKEKREKDERETLEARLDHAQRLEALGTLAGGIAHEFNNTLGAILGYGEMALQLDPNSPNTRKYVEEMVSSGHRAKFIIDQILTFGRKRERVSRPFDVSEAIREIMPMVRMSISGSHNVKLQLGDDIPPILGNPIEIQQVVINLCTNAAHASDEDSLIDVSVAHVVEKARVSLSHGELMPGGFVRVSVEDRGSGIPESILSNIFEPFFTTRSKRGGTGLGLAAVHGHVAGMNGKIDVKSQVGLGTRFDLYFPVSYRKPIPLKEFFNERTLPLGTGQIVLIAQQDSSLRLLLEEKIAALGYEPIGFSSIAPLVTWIEGKAISPDLILLDLDVWPSPPDCLALIDQFAPVPTVFLIDPEMAVPDIRSPRGISVLKKPISSNSLATSLYNQIIAKATEALVQGADNAQ